MSENSEYILLRAMRENLLARGFLLRVDFDSLKKIEENNWSYPISEYEKPIVRKYIQVDIISKILMYGEDIVVLGEAFRRGKEFYSEFLSPSAGDLGKEIKFFFKEIEKLTDNDILKMMSWLEMKTIIINTKLAGSVSKIQFYNVNRVRKLLQELKDFADSNHIVYKRFKHGGMPIVSPATQLPPQAGPLGLYDTFSIVSEGEDPLIDIRIIPFSQDVLNRYVVLITKIQKVLGEMIDNKIYSIERGLSGVFPKSYDNREVPPEEARQIDGQIQSYYANHQPTFVPREMNFNIGTADLTKDLKWYFETYN